MTDSINEAADNRFAAADLEALRSYCDRINVVYTKSHNAASLRKLLIAATAEDSKHYGEKFHDDETELTAEEKHLEAVGLVGLNLRSQAGWEGRRRVITLHRAMAHESTRPQFFAWGRLHCYVPMGVECAVPYPIFEILKDTAGKRLVRKRQVDDEGRIWFKDEWVPNQRFMYSDMGDDPDTADKPRSMMEMIQRLHGLTDGFAGFSKRQLKEVCLRLFISAPEDWDADDMLAAIEAKCGFTAGRVDLSAPDLSKAATA